MPSDVGVAKLVHSNWPSRIKANFHDLSKADMQNILDVLERDYAHASSEERSIALMEMIRNRSATGSD